MAKKILPSRPENHSELQPELHKRSYKETAIVLGSTATLVGVAHITGATDWLMDQSFVSQPPVRDEIVDGMIMASDAMRVVAPPVVLGLAAAWTYKGLNSYRRSDKTAAAMAKLDYAKPKHDTKVGRVRRTIAQVGLATAVGTIAGAGVSVEDEVNKGPNRPIEAAVDVMLPGVSNDNISVLMQDGEDTFMDSSYLDRKELEVLMNQASELGIGIVPFDKELMRVRENESSSMAALQISIPDELFTSLTGELIDDSCTTTPVIVDSAMGITEGSTYSVNQTEVEPIGVQDGIAQLNRNIQIMSDSDMKECLQMGLDISQFGAFIDSDTTTILSQLDMPSGSLVSFEEFQANNEEFWAKNGTPVLLQFIVYIAAFGVSTLANQKNSHFESVSKELANLRMQGVQQSKMIAVEQRRSLREGALTTGFSILTLPAAVAVFNASSTGMQSGVGITEWAVASALVVGPQVAISGRAVKRALKRYPIDENPTHNVDSNDMLPEGNHVQARGITKQYPHTEKPILENVDINLEPGKVTLLTGESGSGKSTLLRMLAALDYPDRGSILIDGKEIVVRNEDERDLRRARNGYVQQEPGLLPGLTAFENVSYPHELQGLDVSKEWVNYLSDKLGVAKQMQKYPEDMSGGEQQRIAIIRALAHKPQFLFADEPTSALSPDLKKTVAKLLREYARDYKATVVCVTHDEAVESEGADDSTYNGYAVANGLVTRSMA